MLSPFFCTRSTSGALAAWLGGVGVDDHFLFADCSILPALSFVGSRITGCRVVLFYEAFIFRGALLVRQGWSVERPGSGASKTITDDEIESE